MLRTSVMWPAIFVVIGISGCADGSPSSEPASPSPEPSSPLDAGDGERDGGDLIDAGHDAGLVADAGATVDAGPAQDAGAVRDDAGTVDAGDNDAGTVDAGLNDAGAIVDAGLVLDAGGEFDAGTPGPQGPRYNEIVQKSTHNSYERSEPLVDQLFYHRVRSVELDVYVNKPGYPTVGQNWFVFHGPSPETTCHQLSDCFDELDLFDRLAPDHEVVTVWIDLKEGFNRANGHGPADLDALIASKFDADAVVSPAFLLDACSAESGSAPSSLRAAVTGECDWPHLESLRGKFMFMLTGGNSCDAGGRLEDYAGGGSSALIRTALIAPDVNGGCPYSSYSNRTHVLALNMNKNDGTNAAFVGQDNLVSRIWDVNDSGAWTQALANGTNHIATDKVNTVVDPWARTHTTDGYPFVCRVGADCDLTGRPEIDGPTIEGGRMLSVQVDSEDIWNNSDDFVFASVERDINANGIWTTFVSSVNSHVDEFAKGCLMARAAPAADAAYFAICRPADINVVRTQQRLTSGASSTTASVLINAPNTVDEDAVAFIRLRMTQGGTCARGEASGDGLTWTTVSEQCFSTSLNHQGLATSSHGSDDVTFRYAQTRHSALGAITREDLTVREIGVVRGALVHDGFQP